MSSFGGAPSSSSDEEHGASFRHKMIHEEDDEEERAPPRGGPPLFQPSQRPRPHAAPQARAPVLRMGSSQLYRFAPSDPSGSSSSNREGSIMEGSSSLAVPRGAAGALRSRVVRGRARGRAVDAAAAVEVLRWTLARTARVLRLPVARARASVGAEAVEAAEGMDRGAAAGASEMVWESSL
jgi:hypothetical protein